MGICGVFTFWLLRAVLLRTCVYKIFCSFGHIPRGGMAEFEKPLNCFPQWLQRSASPPARCGVPAFPHFPPCCFSFGTVASLVGVTWNLTVVCLCTALMADGAGRLSLCLLPKSCVVFGERLTQVLRPFSNGVVCLLLLSC